MLRSLKSGLKSAINGLGYTIKRTPALETAPPEYPPPVFESETLDCYRVVKPFTMTGLECVAAMCQSVEYLVENEIQGDIVECGVWKGGSMMAVAYTLNRLRARRKLQLYDTFEGMPEPTEHDVDFTGKTATAIMAEEDKETSHVWAVGRLEEVRRNMLSTGYPEDRIEYVAGNVEDTIPDRASSRISLLRLDTDWYESTYHELTHLYPRLSVGGVLIIDDYGHWQGARKAVDQYIRENRLKLLLHRVNYTCRIGVKIVE